MRKVKTTIDTEMGDLAKDARALMAATAKVAGQPVARARKRLAATLERGKQAGEDVMEASVDIAGDSIDELRDRITSAMDHGRELYDEVHDDVVERAKSADHTVREHPYRVMSIALGIGAFLGYLSSRHNASNGH